MFTFNIQGGLPVQMQVPGNPLLEHFGGTTIAHLLLESPEEVIAALEALGCRVQAWPVATPKGFTEVLPEVQVPCFSCPSCPWFDPTQVDLCGAYGGVSEEAFEILLERENYRKALSVCPLRKMK